MLQTNRIKSENNAKAVSEEKFQQAEVGAGACLEIATLNLNKAYLKGSELNDESNVTPVTQRPSIRQIVRKQCEGLERAIVQGVQSESSERALAKGRTETNE